MGCQNGRGCPPAHYILMRSDQIYTVRIQHHGASRIFKYSLYHFKGTASLTKARANENSIHFRQPFHNLRNCCRTQSSRFVGQWKHNCFVQFYGFNGINTFRHAQKHQSRAAAQCAHRSKICCTRVTFGAAQQQNSTKITFMRILRPIRQDGKHRFVIQFFHIKDHTAV